MCDTLFNKFLENGGNFTCITNDEGSVICKYKKIFNGLERCTTTQSQIDNYMYESITNKKNLINVQQSKIQTGVYYENDEEYVKECVKTFFSK